MAVRPRIPLTGAEGLLGDGIHAKVAVAGVAGVVCAVLALDLHASPPPARESRPGPAAPVQAAAAPPAAPAADCAAGTWPYLDQRCADKAGGAHRARAVRVIALDKTAPPAVRARPANAEALETSGSGNPAMRIDTPAPASPPAPAAETPANAAPAKAVARPAQKATPRESEERRYGRAPPHARPVREAVHMQGLDGGGDVIEERTYRLSDGRMLITRKIYRSDGSRVPEADDEGGGSAAVYRPARQSEFTRVY